MTLLLFILLLSCGGNSNEDKEAENTKPEQAEKKEVAKLDGEPVYKLYCTVCHGDDGKLGINDAGDLTESTMTMEERIERIEEGKGMMTPYKDVLSERQIQAVAEYLDKLK